jgi:hypothetical protein
MIATIKDNLLQDLSVYGESKILRYEIEPSSLSYLITFTAEVMVLSSIDEEAIINRVVSLDNGLFPYYSDAEITIDEIVEVENKRKITISITIKKTRS